MGEVMTESVDQTANLPPILRRRLQDRKEWEAYWKVRKMEAEGAPFITLRYYVHRAFDFPATFFREKIVEPLHDKYKKPYYHRRLNRVPEIDQCGVNDMACFFEANEQYRLDKMVDGNILDILKQRIERCFTYNENNLNKCANVLEDFEEAELNFFIKYGELGSEADCRDVYMKQKHRMIWERRHPEIMEERERLYKEHKEQLKAGKFDYSFWKKGMFFQDKKNHEPPYEFFLSKSTLEDDKPLSKDWKYYKKVQEDPEFDKEQGKKSSIRFF